jgi:CheY-like chemotaxis protein
MLSRVIREDISLLVDPSPGPAWVRVDPNQIEQVILNLVLNARDALPKGGQIRLSVSRDSSDVSLRVTDNGIGMSADVRDRVFEPFFTTKEGGRGTGLGLASVYGIVRQSNGMISVDSTEGVGTTFTMVFPAAPAPAGARSADGEAVVEGRQEKVLLVEDEDAVRRVLRVMLEQHGYQVVEAATPAEALSIFDRHLHDIRLLVTDVVMPGMDGPALAQRLVSLQPRLVVLFISGYTDIDPGTLRLGHRNMGFLSKPIEAARLAAKVRELIVTS